jgi:tetratricopeptide (TPR) repeat protein
MRNVTLVLAVTLFIGLPGVTMPAEGAEAPAKAAPAGAKYDEARLKELEAALARKPKDRKLRMEAAEAHYQVGHAMMIDASLPPRVKYPGALKHFRHALMLNPKHAKAAGDKKMVEDIYRQMGRPIPQ